MFGVRIRRWCVIGVTLLSPIVVHADWHSGTVSQINIGYDGATVSFLLSGWVRSNCTCYPAWPNYMCLDASRPALKLEYALLLAAHLQGQTVSVNIDETTCRVVAMYKG